MASPFHYEGPKTRALLGILGLAAFFLAVPGVAAEESPIGKQQADPGEAALMGIFYDFKQTPDRASSENEPRNDKCRGVKRDFDLIRSVLLQVEAAPAGEPLMQLGTREEVTAAELVQHLEIMIEEGLIEGEVFSASQCSFGIQKLTWKGHDFLETARNDASWNRVIGFAKEKGLALTVSVISGLLGKEALKLAGL